MAGLTERSIQGAITAARRAQKSTWLTESLGRGQGSLTLKVTVTAASWYYAYTPTGTKNTDRYPIGPYGVGQVTLANARERAQELATIKRTAPGGDVRAYLGTQERERQAREAEEARRTEALRQAALNVGRHTLQALIDQYVQHLELSGKQSTAHVRGALRLHVAQAFPALAATPAHRVTRQEMTDVLRPLIEEGKGRMAGMIRSYLRAAYALGLRASTDATVPQALVAFQITSNPVADVGALTQFNRVRNRALSEVELTTFLHFLRQEPGLMSDIVQVSLLLGGQRLAQLLRTKVTDYQDGVLTLLDTKGRRTQPRIHALPVSPQAAGILDRRVVEAQALGSEWLFTSTGRVPVVENSVSHFVRDWVHGQTAISPFSVGDLRRTCETLLASQRVNADVRAHIQSHGLGGVQNRHYNRYSYMTEKRVALTAWSTWLASL
ncbi:MAG: tyrosine-type recombinase/integrase [Acidiferrobacter thiooxydans]